MISQRFLVLFVLFCISSCTSIVTPCTATPPFERVYIIESGWHAELGLPVEELHGGLAFYRAIFPGARVILFGYGKKTFFTAPPDALSEYFLGPFPGPAVIHAVGLRVTPIEAYGPQEATVLRLPQGGSNALSAYIWNDLAKDTSGKPIIVAHSSNPDGLFYAAKSTYTLLHTCNTWTAEALHHCGLPISANAVSFSGQVMSQVNKTLESQCSRPLLRN
jgi:hypothetical protein